MQISVAIWVALIFFAYDIYRRCKTVFLYSNFSFAMMNIEQRRYLLNPVIKQIPKFLGFFGDDGIPQSGAEIYYPKDDKNSTLFCALLLV